MDIYGGVFWGILILMVSGCSMLKRKIGRKPGPMGQFFVDLKDMIQSLQYYAQLTAQRVVGCRNQR